MFGSYDAGENLSRSGKIRALKNDSHSSAKPNAFCDMHVVYGGEKDGTCDYGLSRMSLRAERVKLGKMAGAQASCGEIR